MAPKGMAQKLLLLERVPFQFPRHGWKFRSEELIAESIYCRIRCQSWNDTDCANQKAGD